jgi:acetolactate synthase small subunit
LGIKVNVVVKNEESVFTKISGYFNEIEAWMLK